MADLTLWGIAPAAHYRYTPRRPLKITAGTLAHVRDAAGHRAAQGWAQLVAVPARSHPDNIATCGTCRRSWDAQRHPTPAMLCPFCNGDARAAARWRAYLLGGGEA